MIVRCPSCSSRREIASLQPLNSATLVDCADCGHHWIEGSTLPALIEAGQAEPARGDMETGGPAVHALVHAARGAQKEFHVVRRARRVRAAGWVGLLIVALLPLVAGFSFPEQVVAALPASIGLYDWAGRSVNIYGLEIRQLDVQHLVVDGRKVIAVKGELANVSTSVRKIPWLRFGLRSKDNAEVYHWTLDTEIRPLRPGEVTSFVTRLASPPEVARNVEIRFARADEIGSNNIP